MCTPWAVAWTQADAAGDVHLYLLRGPGNPADAVRGPRVSADSPLATDGRSLVFLAPGDGGVLQAQRLDLTGETPVPLSASGLPERDVARAVGVSAHVEVEPESEPVEVHAQDFALRKLSDAVVLLTYRSAHIGPSGALERHTLRSSIWRLEASGWQIVFHQGTPTGAFAQNLDEPRPAPQVER